MRKFISLFMALLLTFFLIGCQDITTTLTTNQTTTAVETTTEVTTSSNVTATTESTTEMTTTEIITTEAPTTTAVETTTEETTTDVMTTTEIDPLVEINLYSINDFHGGAYSDIDMISRIGAYLKSLDEYHLELSNGDIFQGTAISNYYHGEVLVDALNEAGFDGFVVGNHEFDWGIDVLADYNDGNETNGEFDQPILAANIVYEDTQTPLPFTEPYLIEEFDGVRIGIIGLIGNLENSIAASRLNNIEFLDPVLTAATYARSLRLDHDVDIVVVYIHDSSYQNDEFAELSGLFRIDAMFNGHSHQYETSYISRDGLDMPYAQMNNYDTSLVKISLTYDKSAGKLVSFDVNAIENDELYQTDPEIDAIISMYANDSDYVSFIGEVLTVSQNYYSRYDMAQWGASVVRDYAGVDIGAVNAGGFRVSMLPGDLTMGELITIYPFDNVIKTSEMTGLQIQNFYIEVRDEGSDVVFDDALSFNSSTQRLEINGVPIELGTYYTVGAVDYIFDKTYYDFLEGMDIQQTVFYMRDLLAMDLRNATEGFNPYDGTHIDE